jgi:uncharacterized protein YhjY with autotransporter beta-barrel domain
MNSKLKLLCLVSCLLINLRPAEAQVNASWSGDANPPNNLFSDPANWNGGTVPTGTASVSTTATIDLPGTATTLSGDLVVTGSVVVNATTAGFTAYTVQVNHGGVLSLDIPTGGTFTVNGTGYTSFIGGLDDGTSGTFNLTGPGTFYLPTGTNDFGVGQGSKGTVTQTAGFFDAAGNVNVYIGGDAGVVGNATSTGSGIGVYTISGTSTFTANNLYIAPGSTVGTGTSTGAFIINGGIVNANNVILGVDDTSGVNGTGTISNSTGTLTQSAGLLNVADNLDIGENPGSVENYALSGTGTLSASTLTIGDLAGSSGTFTQSGGTGTVTTAMNVGNNGNGIYKMSGGSLTISVDAELNVGAGTGTGLLVLSGGTLTTNGALNIGAASGTGTFTLTGGGTLDLEGGATLGGGGSAGVFNDNGGTIDYNSSLVVSDGSTFNQNANNTPSSTNPLVLESGGVYNLNAGTLSIGGDFETPGTSGISATSGALFNFAGGTVATTSAWTDELDGTVTGNSTINTAGGSATLTGDLTGGGTLTVTGGGTVAIDTTAGDSSSGSWGIDVVDGTVNALATTFPASGNIAIGSSGIVSMTTAGSSALGGALSGSGAFDVTFGATTDTLELTRAASFTGVTTLSGGGTLQVLNGSFGNIGTDGGTNKLVIGAGTGSGLVDLTGNNTYTGLTTVDSGYTLRAHNFTGAVTNSGSLGSNVALTNTPGTTTLTIGGNLVSTGTLLIRTNSLNADLFHVGGTANISGTLDFVDPAAGSITGTLVTTNAPGDLTYTGPSTLNPNRFVSVSIAPNGANQDLILTLNASTVSSVPGLNLTPNQSAIAGPLNGFIINSSGLNPNQFANLSKLLNDIGRAGTSNSQLAANLDQIGPESLQYAPTIAIINATSMVQSVDGFTSNINHSLEGFDTSAINIVAPGFDSDMGRSMQSMFAYDPSPGGFHQAAPNGTNYYPDGESGTISDSAPAAASGSSPVSSSSERMSDTPAPSPFRTEANSVTLRKPWSRFSEFIGADVTVADLNQDQGITYAPSSKASYSAVGAIGGIAYRMTSNLSAGILFDYKHTDAKTDSAGSKMDVNAYSPGVFATLDEKGFFLNGVFSYGIDNYSNSRSVPSVGSVATSNPNGTQYVGDLDGGYEFHPAREWTVTPLAGLTYTHLDVDSFNEIGASPDNLDVAAQHDDSLRSRLGASVVFTVHPGQLTLQPNLTFMWQHEFMDQNPLITSSFSDISSQTFSIHSVGMGRDSALVGIGLTATLDNSMAIFLEALADANGNYNAENIVGGFKGSF